MAKAPPQFLGQDSDWNIDFIPKAIIADGLLVKTLIYTKVHESLNLQLIDGTCIYKDGKVYKVPCTESALFRSSLLGFIEKRRFKKFLKDVNDNIVNPNSSDYADISNMTALDYMKVFGLDPYTMTFFGRTMAEKDNSYLTRSIKELIPNMELYQNSRTRNCHIYIQCMD